METNLVFWIKMAGCLMVFLGCTALGMRLSARLAERQRALSKLMDILLNLKSQMCTMAVPLFTAFENLAKESTGGVWAEVFSQCGSIMKEEHLDAGMAWKEAVKKTKYQLPLDEADWGVLSDFGDIMGKYDRQNQESVLLMEKEKIAALEKKAREAMDTKGKLYRNLGALCGAAVVILLI